MMKPGFNIMTQSQRLRVKYGKTPLGKFNGKSSAGTIMASVWWNSQGMIMKEYFEHGKTVTGNMYAQQF